MKRLETKSCEEIMNTAYKPLEYCVDGLLTQLEYIESGDSSDGNFEMGDSNIATITAPADGNDFIAMMADGLRSQLASQGIHAKPFNSTE